VEKNEDRSYTNGLSEERKRSEVTPFTHIHHSLQVLKQVMAPVGSVGHPRRINLKRESLKLL
jgi:hypothetical protein